MPDILIYSSSSCPYCTIAKQLLDHKGFRYKEILVDNNPGARNKMVVVSKRYTVPQIFINQMHIGGCNELYALENSGKLDTLLIPDNKKLPHAPETDL